MSGSSRPRREWHLCRHARGAFAAGRDSADRVVLCAYEFGTHTSGILCTYDPDGSVFWVAQPRAAYDAWVGASLEGDILLANFWSCWQVAFSVAAGWRTLAILCLSADKIPPSRGALRSDSPGRAETCSLLVR